MGQSMHMHVIYHFVGKLWVHPRIHLGMHAIQLSRQGFINSVVQALVGVNYVEASEPMNILL